MIDRYTKVILTVIAVALSAIVLQGFIPAANAQSSKGCGETEQSACFVPTIRYGNRFEVTVSSKEPLPVSAKDPLPVKIRE